MEHICCPKCGGENSNYGKCEYCGHYIEPNIMDILDHKIPPHGIHKVEINPRVLKQKYNKFEDRTKTSYIGADDDGWFYVSYHEKDRYESRQHICIQYIHNGWEEKGYLELFGLEPCIILADSKKYESYNIFWKIEKDTLLALCSAKSFEINFEYNKIISEKDSKLIQLILCVFYNTFYDSSLFSDSPSLLYTVYNQRKAEEKSEIEQSELRFKQFQKEEERKSCMIGIFVFIILAILIIGGIIKLMYRI